MREINHEAVSLRERARIVVGVLALSVGVSFLSHDGAEAQLPSSIEGIEVGFSCNGGGPGEHGLGVTNNSGETLTGTITGVTSNGEVVEGPEYGPVQFATGPNGVFGYEEVEDGYVVVMVDGKSGAEIIEVDCVEDEDVPTPTSTTTTTKPHNNTTTTVTEPTEPDPISSTTTIAGVTTSSSTSTSSTTSTTSIPASTTSTTAQEVNGPPSTVENNENNEPKVKTGDDHQTEKTGNSPTTVAEKYLARTGPDLDPRVVASIAFALAGAGILVTRTASRRERT